MTVDLLSLQQWLLDEQVRRVAMEATGKTDVKDAHWIAELRAHGLIEASFVPPTRIQELRALTRDRRQFHRAASQHVQRIQKVLQGAHIKIDSVISDVLGKRGRALHDASVGGETDPEKLVIYANYRRKAPKEVLTGALRGVVTERHRTSLRRHLAMVDAINRCIAEIDAEVAALLEPSRRQVELLDPIPGVNINTAEANLAEIGVDRSRSPTAAHPVSWAGLSPRSDESAGKRRNTRIGKGGPWLKATLVQAAWAAGRAKDTHMRSLFLRIKGKRGPKKAAIAVAAEILRSARHRLTRDEPTKEPDRTPPDPLRKEREARRLVGRLQKLGNHVEKQTTTASSAGACVAVS